MTTARDAVWIEHQDTWSNCARCKLVDDRLLTAPQKGKFPTQVPMPGTLGTCQDPGNILPLPTYPVALMLSYPDMRQERYRCMWANVQIDTKLWSYQIQTLLNAQYIIGPKNLPFDLREVPVFSALGCRPINHRDIRNTLAPAAGPTSSCRPRWVAELRMIDPQLVIAFGHHAFVALFPKKSKRDDFNQAVGEVRTFEVEGVRGPLTYDAYIAPDVSEVHSEARPEHWSTPFDFTRPEARTKDHVQDLRWHLVRSMWIAHVLHLNRESMGEDLKLPTNPAWGRVLTGSNLYHDTKASIVDSAKAVNERVQRMDCIERSDQDVRRALSGEIAPTEDQLEKTRSTYAFSRPVRVSERRARQMEKEAEEARGGES